MSVSFSAPSPSTYDLLKDEYGPFIGIPEAAKIVGNHVSTWYKWIENGIMPVPSILVGKSRRIRLIDLCVYLDANAGPATSKPKSTKKRGRPPKVDAAKLFPAPQ